MKLPQADSKEKKVGRVQEEVPGEMSDPVGVDILGEMGWNGFVTDNRVPPIYPIFRGCPSRMMMAVPLKSLARKTSSQEPKVDRVAVGLCWTRSRCWFLICRTISKHKMDDTKRWLAKSCLTAFYGLDFVHRSWDASHREAQVTSTATLHGRCRPKEDGWPGSGAMNQLALS